MPYLYDLTLGMPHTNHRGLSEPVLLKHAAHYEWASIAAAIGTPLSRLRTSAGGEVYAAVYYVEERLPPATPLESFRLDDVVRFAVALRSFKNIAVEGRIVFDRQERMEDASRVEEALEPHATEVPYPFIRFGNIFITPVKGNSVLQMAPPASIDLFAMPPLPNDENPYHLTREAGAGGGLGVLDEGWTPAGSFEHQYHIDIDRDTNGAGLVYFANYVAFMETAERLALGRLMPADGETLAGRTLLHRRIAYYGNADAADRIAVGVTVLRKETAAASIGLRYRIQRQEDGRTICLSEAIKALPCTP